MPEVPTTQYASYYAAYAAAPTPSTPYASYYPSSTTIPTPTLRMSEVPTTTIPESAADISVTTISPYTPQSHPPQSMNLRYAPQAPPPQVIPRRAPHIQQEMVRYTPQEMDLSEDDGGMLLDARVSRLAPPPSGGMYGSFFLDPTASMARTTRVKNVCTISSHYLTLTNNISFRKQLLLYKLL